MMMTKQEINKWIKNIEEYININFNTQLLNSKYYFKLDINNLFSSNGKTFNFNIYFTNKQNQHYIGRYIFVGYNTNEISFIIKDIQKTISIDKFKKWLDENLFNLYISILIDKFLVSKISDREKNLEEIIVKYITNNNFNFFYNNLPISVQDKYNYIINANKFDLI